MVSRPVSGTGPVHPAGSPLTPTLAQVVGSRGVCVRWVRAVGLGGCCWKGRREGPAAACRPSSVVVPTCQGPQYRTAAAARKSASLHRDVQKPKDRQQQQQGEVPECRLWLTGMAMSGRRSSLNCLGRFSSSTSSPDAAEGCEELQLRVRARSGSGCHPACMAAPRYTGEAPLEQCWLPCCCRGPGERRRHRRPVASICCVDFPERTLAGSVSVRIFNGNRRWCCLLPDACWLGLARLPSLEWHPPGDLSECFSCRRPPLAPLLRRGAVWRTLLKQGKAEKGEGKHAEVCQKINFGFPCHSFSSVFHQSSVGSSPVGLRHLDSVHAAALSIPPHGCGRR